MVEDKINSFLEELTGRNIEIYKPTAFLCKDALVTFTPTDTGVDISLFDLPISVDYEIGITDQDVELWNTEELLEEVIE